MSQSIKQLLDGIRIVAIKGNKCKGCGLCELSEGTPVAYRAAALYAPGAELLMPMCGTEPTADNIAEHLKFYADCSANPDALIDALQDPGPFWFTAAAAMLRMSRRVSWFLKLTNTKIDSQLAQAVDVASPSVCRRFNRLEWMILVLSVDFLPAMTAAHFCPGSLGAYTLRNLTLGWSALAWLISVARDCTHLPLLQSR